MMKAGCAELSKNNNYAGLSAVHRDKRQTYICIIFVHTRLCEAQCLRSCMSVEHLYGLPAEKHRVGNRLMTRVVAL